MAGLGAHCVSVSRLAILYGWNRAQLTATKTPPRVSKDQCNTGCERLIGACKMTEPLLSPHGLEGPAPGRKLAMDERLCVTLVLASLVIILEVWVARPPVTR